ncbi:hypothetical protein GU926_13670 [Nibribacter ruber]|uniref:Uncharacterized protein n=1 Tax=Nibribacter ruber TaxID=2698458 RepID=A0A6P1P0K7_9BACT|nr:hypothetical protein [Nibribacter ruber]QHL88424.1 hypothetical protein GU926_13670 [Nibribacter ruber]
MLLFFILICVRVISELYKLAKGKPPIDAKAYIPLLLLTLTLLDFFFNPLNIDLEKAYGKILFRACYEGTQNQATFKLREENTFELHATGAFFYDEFFLGSYIQKGDTLILDFRGKKPAHFSDKLFMDNHNRILTINRKVNDGTLLALPFYYGYCKGTN